MLFRTKELAVNAAERKTPVTAEVFVEKFVKCKVRDALNDCFPDIEQGKSYDFVSLSEWSMSETPARMLVEAMQAGVLSAGRAVSELHRDWILAELNGEKPFE